MFFFCDANPHCDPAQAAFQVLSISKLDLWEIILTQSFLQTRWLSEHTWVPIRVNGLCRDAALCAVEICWSVNNLLRRERRWFDQSQPIRESSPTGWTALHREESHTSQ